MAGVGFEDDLARIAALGDVAPRIGRHRECEAGHDD
jgi:hypothetical protein